MHVRFRQDVVSIKSLAVAISPGTNEIAESNPQGKCNLKQQHKLVWHQSSVSL
jgi:hypothetical protein